MGLLLMPLHLLKSLNLPAEFWWIGTFATIVTLVYDYGVYKLNTLDWEN